MSIRRENDNWMRFRTDNKIYYRHAEMNSALFRNKWFNWLDRQLQPNRWYISVIAAISLYILIACIINLNHLAYSFTDDDKKMRDFGKFVDDRASNLASVVSISMAVIAFLVSNIAIKELYAVKLLFRRTKLIAVIIFALTTLGIFVLVSADRFTYVAKDQYNNVALASAIMLVIVLVLIGFLFVKIIDFVDPAKIDAFINDQLQIDSFKLIKFGLQRQYSLEYYQQVMRQAGVKPYNLSDVFSPSTLSSIMSLINNSDDKTVDVPLRYVTDLDLIDLRDYLHERKNEELVYQTIYLGLGIESSDSYVFALGKENSEKDKQRLNGIIRTISSFEKTPVLTEVRKHHDEKIVSLAESGKNKDLERVLIGIETLYKLQFEHKLPQPFSVTTGLPTLFSQALSLAIDKQYFRCFFAVYNQVIGISVEALKRLDIDIYTSVLFIYTNLYKKIHRYRNDESYLDFFPYALSTAANYEALISELTLLKRRLPLQIKAINRMSYETYAHLCKLGYYVINKSDFTRLKDIADILDRDIFDQPDVRAQMDYYRLRNQAGADPTKVLQAKESYEDAYRLRTYRRHATLALQSWVLQLKRKARIDDDVAAKMLQYLRVNYQGSQDALDDILNIFSGKWIYYFDWTSWEMPSLGDSDDEKLPDAIGWLSFGFFISQIIQNQIQFSAIESTATTSGVTFELLAKQFKKYKEELTSNFDKWHKLLPEVIDESDLNLRTDSIIRAFERAAEALTLNNLRIIAETPVDKKLIKEFYSQAVETWKKEAHLWQIFAKQNNILKPSKNQQLPFIGRRGREGQIKRFFLEYDKHNDINILRPIVGQVGRDSDTAFLNEVQRQVPVFRKGKLTELIVEGIEQLRELTISPNIIIVPSVQSFANDQFLQHALLKRSVNEAETFKIGEFDNVPVYFSHSHAAQDHVIIASLDTAFEVEYLNGSDFQEGFLDVEVEEIDQLFAKNSAKKMAEIKGDASLAEPTELNIRNGVNLTIGINAKLKIKNVKAIRVGKIA
jgi:hypothetical protein